MRVSVAAEPGHQLERTPEGVAAPCGCQVAVKLGDDITRVYLPAAQDARIVVTEDGIVLHGIDITTVGQTGRAPNLAWQVSP